MTDIDLPDWVVAEALKAWFYGEEYEGADMSAFTEDMRTTLRAAMSAWVVPTAKIGTCAEVKWLQGGPCQLPPKEVLYTFLQEKPE